MQVNHEKTFPVQGLKAITLSVATGGAGKIASLGTPKHQPEPNNPATCRYCGCAMDAAGFAQEPNGTWNIDLTE